MNQNLTETALNEAPAKGTVIKRARIPPPFRIAVAIYARISTTSDQKKKKKVQDPLNQLIRLRQEARNRDLKIYGEYVDEITGKDAHRPALDAMIADAKAHRFPLILVIKLDRLIRSLPNFYVLSGEFDKIGVKFSCIDQPMVSTETASGRYFTAIIGAAAEYERDIISERTKDGLARLRAQGIILGRRPDGTTKKILDLHKLGRKPGEIAKILSMSPGAVKQRIRRSKREGE
jgi:DNA invertase Pin-like site-specific DNA recombinase